MARSTYTPNFTAVRLTLSIRTEIYAIITAACIPTLRPLAIHSLRVFRQLTGRSIIPTDGRPMAGRFLRPGRKENRIQGEYDSDTELAEISTESRFNRPGSNTSTIDV